MMARRLQILLGIALPALAVCLTASARGPSEEDDDARQLRLAAAAREDVLRLADSLDRDEDEIERQTHAIAEKHDLRSVMWVFKLREKVGVGVGEKPEVIQPDGIELKLLMLAKKPPSARDMEAQSADLKRLAQVVRAVALVTPKYAQKYTKLPLDRKVWNDSAGDMGTASDDLIAAINDGKDRAFQKALNDLDKSCIECHQATVWDSER